MLTEIQPIPWWWPRASDWRGPPEVALRHCSWAVDKPRNRGQTSFDKISVTLMVQSNITNCTITTEHFIQMIYNVSDVSDFSDQLSALQRLPCIVQALLSKHDQVVFSYISFCQKIQRLTFTSAPLPNCTITPFFQSKKVKLTTLRKYFKLCVSTWNDDQKYQHSRTRLLNHT